MYLHRELESILQEALSQFPVVLVTGPRQSGKSTLLEHCLKGFNLISLDDPLARSLALSDPALFLKTYEAPLILDEIQYAPMLLSHLKILVDKDRRRYGQYVLTGSQFFPLMKGVSESLAGRIAIFQLYPLSWKELVSHDVFNDKAVVSQMLNGFYPEFQIQPALNRKIWHSSYFTTYIERDIRSLRNIQDLGQFQRFLILIAARAGQLFNLTEIGKECGISQTTARDWLTLLQATSIIYLLEPYSKNLTKRVIKSSKVFFVDTGLLCYLLRIDALEQLITGPFAGHIFENMIVMEVVKRFAGQGIRPPCYFYRTSHGLEIDLLIDRGHCLDAYEIKFSATPNQDMAQPLKQFRKEYPLRHSKLLSLYPHPHPFFEDVIGVHWSEGIQEIASSNPTSY